MKLTDLFLMLKSDKIRDILEQEKINTSVFENATSLKISHEIALLSLQETNPDAYKFFFFLAMLPDGATKAQLDSMWKGEWQASLDTLEKAGFMEQRSSNGRMVLKPFMITFAQTCLDKKSTDAYNMLICRFYANHLKSCYR